jgi:hypothetical protein
MKLLLLSIFVLFNISFLFPQNLYNLYKNYLPANHLQFLTKDAIEAQLERDAHLDPSILYWRLYYYQEAFGKKNFNNNVNGFWHAALLAKEKAKLRNVWLDEQMKIVKEKYLYSLHYSRINSDLKEYYTEIAESNVNISLEEPEYDKNLDNFYQYIYYSKKEGMKYDNNVDYSSMNLKAKEEVLSSIDADWVAVSTDYRVEKEDFVVNVLNNWNVMRERKDKTPDVPKYLSDYYDNIYSMSRLNRFGIKGGVVQYVFDNATDISKFDNGEQIDIGKITETQKMFLSFNYNLPINNLKSVFSYFNFSLIVSKGNYKIDTTETALPFSKRYNVVDSNNYHIDILSVKDKRLDLNSNYGVFLKLLTPVLIWKENIIVEAGVVGGINSLSYKSEVMTDFRSFQVTYSQMGGYKTKPLASELNVLKSEDRTENNLYISPSIAINIAFKIISIGMEINYNSTGVNLGINF